MDMSPADVRSCGEKLAAAGMKITRCYIAGGEPLVHPQLQELIDAAARYIRPVRGEVLSNGVASRDHIRLPRRWRWKVTPLDVGGLTDGKEHHTAFFVSPADYGVESKYSDCLIAKKCGIGFEKKGFTMCPISGTLGRVLGIDPYRDDPEVGEFPEDICRQCPYGMPYRKREAFLRKFDVYTISPTYQAALGRKSIPK